MHGVARVAIMPRPGWTTVTHTQTRRSHRFIGQMRASSSVSAVTANHNCVRRDLQPFYVAFRIPSGTAVILATDGIGGVGDDGRTDIRKPHPPATHPDAATTPHHPPSSPRVIIGVAWLARPSYSDWVHRIVVVQHSQRSANGIRTPSNPDFPPMVSCRNAASGPAIDGCILARCLHGPSPEEGVCV
jgi:hypothetical protein